jgi:hypothetical protein
VFPETTCHICGKSPILGVLYRCYNCRDITFCQNCEASQSDIHFKQHALIKIRAPELDPQVLPEPVNPSEAVEVFFEEEKRVQPEDKDPSRDNFHQRREKMDYQTQLVMEDVGENTQVLPGLQFTKTWTLCNIGKDAWPADAKLAFMEGYNFGLVSEV